MFDMGMSNLDLEVLEVETAGDIAYDVGRYTIAGPGGQPVDRGKYIVIWKNVAGDWKIHRDIFNTDIAIPTDTTSVPGDTTLVRDDTTP
jgi:ketosteroid isomerase-like protein